MQYEHFRMTVEEGEVGLVMDFGQNINHRKQFEAQSSHYNQRQSTILPLVCFFKCNMCSVLVTHEICCISDDLKYDACSVKAYKLEAIHILEQNGCNIRTLYEWCDNCGLKFKSKYPFLLLSNMKKSIVRNYWGKNHGKGPADGVIGRVSQFMQSAIAQGKASISHGMDMVLYLQMCLGTSDFNPDAKKCQHVRRNFVFVDKIDHTSNKVKVKTLSGTRNFHCIKNTGSQGVLQVWRSSCMCRFSS